MRYSLRLVMSALLGVASHLSAGPYNSAEPMPFPIGPEGKAQELSWNTDGSGPFPQRFSALTNALDNRPRADHNPDRQKILDRIAAARKAEATAALTPEQLAGLAADELRVGQFDEALNRLAPRSRDRVPDFRILATLAHTYAMRGEWHEALRWHQAAFLDAEFPESLAQTTVEQLAWLKRVERDYYRRWLRIHQERQAQKADPTKESIFPLFENVRFVNEAGVYEPGKLTAAERAKLPADAVAIVQQLLLWDPTDTALYWLLAELYAANGQLRQADTIFYQCAWSRQYGNRAELMAHRTAVQAAVTQLPPEADPTDLILAPLPATPAVATVTGDPVEEAALPSRGKVIAVVVVFSLVALVLIGLQLRAVWKRGRWNCHPFG
ncbi:MAG: hypothetical protein LC104_18735 [Bacteroidales bacterium]|nr:hypothetical protein [Bacteroidales bacterium]